MKKQELIERIEGLKNIFGNKVEYIEIDAAIELVSKLDEPQKVTIPQFVADWIETAKTVYSLSGGMTFGGPGVNKWLAIDDNQETFARAWLDGYEVEKEKRYIITIKALQEDASYLKYSKVFQNWFFGMDESSSDRRIKHTRKELGV